MRLFLDTHTFIWFVTDHPKLSATAKTLIENGDNEILVSIVSLWEIAIKMSLGKLEMGSTFDELFPHQLIENDISVLPIEISHLSQLIQLPLHHRDPFDRLLIAQSIEEGIPIISYDTAFDVYPIERLWAKET